MILLFAAANALAVQPKLLHERARAAAAAGEIKM
jgi:hypothetical protein